MKSISELQHAYGDPLSQSLPTHQIKNLMTDKNSTKVGGKISSLVLFERKKSTNIRIDSIVNINSH